MRTKIELNEEDIQSIIQDHIATMVRINFAPGDITIKVCPKGSNTWVAGRISIDVDIPGYS